MTMFRITSLLSKSELKRCEHIFDSTLRALHLNRLTNMQANSMHLNGNDACIGHMRLIRKSVWIFQNETLFFANQAISNYSIATNSTKKKTPQYIFIRTVYRSHCNRLNKLYENDPIGFKNR